MTAVRRLLIIVCALAATTMASAQTTRRRPTPAPPPAPEPTTVTTNPEQVNVPPSDQAATAPVTADTDKDISNPRALHLTLDEAIKMTMERNLGIEISRYNERMAGESLRSQYGPFDWFATGNLSHTSSETPTSSRLASSAQRLTIWDFGVSQLLPTGGTYRVSFNNDRSAQAGGFVIRNPTYDSNLGLSFTQPLLRNFGVDVTERFIYIARNTLGIDREAFRLTLLGASNDVEQAYLNLVYTRQFVDVVKEALFLARDQARITQIRIDVGASAPLDILQPRVQIATEEEALINATAAVRNAEDSLRALLHLDPADWDRPIIPDDKVGYTPFAVDEATAVARALDLRPEVRQNALTTGIKRIEYNFARNQTRPQLDLSLLYRNAGIGGPALATDPLTGQPTNIPSTTYATALRQVGQGTFPTWTIGFTIGVPVTNIGARAEAKRAELDLAQSKTIEQQTRENITVQVRAAARLIDTAAKQITASRAAREAAEQNLEAERKRFENGMTTNFQVLQIQQQLSDARVQELNALVGYNKALAAYHAAVGDLLDVRNIKVAEEPVQEPHFPFFSRIERYNWLYYDKSKGSEEKK
jgi:HAE1 family hydrophobic/amphiphilic exporter-1